jgi:hypothetical protein
LQYARASAAARLARATRFQRASTKERFAAIGLSPGGKLLKRELRARFADLLKQAKGL